MANHPSNGCRPLEFRNPSEDANRYAWLRDGGFFHRVCGAIGASGATGDQFDALVDEAMAQDEGED